MELKDNNIKVCNVEYEGETYFMCNHVYRLAGISWKGLKDLEKRLGSDVKVKKLDVKTTKRIQPAWFIDKATALKLIIEHGKSEYSKNFKAKIISDYFERAQVQ